MFSAQKHLRKFASPQKASFALRFFKTGPGQYGEGDLFLGITMPEIRSVARLCKNASTSEISVLLKSPFHEDRMLGLVLLISLYKREKDLKNKKKILSFYLKHKKGINNWDLVDASTANILGDYCFRSNDESLMWKLARSKRHWDKRLAMVGTLAFIRMGKPKIAFEMAATFLDEEEDLMHKASGWMLRYSIEKFSRDEQKRILNRTR